MAEIQTKTGRTSATDAKALATSAPQDATDQGTAITAAAPPILSPLWWRMAQRGGAALGCLLLLPLFAAIYVAVKTTSPGPFFFKQRRRGLNGKVFSILKIRTLRVGSEKNTALGVDRKSNTITPVGYVLRQLKLDELPQMWNVVTGDMELVGPRPIPIALEDTLRENILAFRERNRVRPGLTAFSQIVVVDNGTGDQMLEDWTERFQAELHYIRNKSVFYDLVVMALSALYLTRSFWRVAKHAISKKKAAEQAQSDTQEQAAPKFTATRVLTTPIADLDYDGVIEHIADLVERKASRYIGVCPVHSVVEGLWNQRHRAVLEGATLNTADGMPIVWAQKLLGNKTASRVYGPTLTLKLIERAAQDGWRVAFYGGHPERVVKLADRLREDYPGIEIVEAYSPPFRKLTPEEDREICERLTEKRPDLVFVGLGCPKQERWMNEHVGRVPGVMLGVGAAFDFHAGALRQSPALLQKLGLEWAFRLYCEPRRLFKRYSTTNPSYLFHLGLQVLKSKLRGSKPRFLLAEPRGYQPLVDANPDHEGPRVAICLGTCHRPQLLRDTLEGIASLQIPEAWSHGVEVRVVDNDAGEGARAVVDSMREKMPGFLVRYAVEPDRNISKVRNRALDLGPAEWIAFLDDDERPDVLWLQRLIETVEQSSCDGAFGSVLALLPDSAPAWAERSGLWDKLPRPANVDLPAPRCARTSNALVRGGWFYERGLRFDPCFGRTGAEDTELFLVMDRLGARLRAVPDATVRETIREDQASARWLSRRYFRNGKNYERLARRHEGLGSPWARPAKRSIDLGLTFLRALPPLLIGKTTGLVRVRCKFALLCGGVYATLLPRKATPEAPYPTATEKGGVP